MNWSFTKDELDLLSKALETQIDVNAEIEEEDPDLAEESDLCLALLKKIEGFKN